MNAHSSSAGGATMNIKFGPAGACGAFAANGGKGTAEIPAWLAKFGLSAFEYSCGRGVRVSSKTAEEIGRKFAENGIAISLHAPYFINLATSEPPKQQKNIGYFLSSLKACRAFGGERVVFHPGSLVGKSRPEAMRILHENLTEALAAIEGAGFSGMKICAETMGKKSQLGTPDEIIEIVNRAPNILPCIDFGHVNAREGGILKNKDDFRRLIDKFFAGAGEEKAKNMHIHFSKIEYNKSGEVRHLTFEDEKFGPDFRPLLDVIKEYDMKPAIICESAGTQTFDAVTMKEYFYEN